MVGGSTRRDVFDPEETGEEGRVDLYVRVGDQAYALEHTVVQPFGNRMALEQPYRTIRACIEEWFTDSLPGTAFYELHIPVDFRPPGLGKPGARRLAALRGWIEAKVNALHTRAAGRPRPPGPRFYTMDRIRGRPCGWRCEFTVARSTDGVVPPRERGSFGVSIGSPDDPRGAFIGDLSRAFGRKWSKLARCKDEADGVRTILVLEGVDMPFGYDLYLAEHLRTLLGECPVPPDDIYLVCPDVAFWQVWVVKQGGVHWPDEGMPMPHKGYAEFAPPAPGGAPAWIVEASPSPRRAAC